jgi:hypothetical protein
VLLTADDRELWAPRPPDRSVVPVLLYHRVAPKAFARQMALLDHAGYETITLEEFVRLIRREQVRLPPRPLLLTFDGGRADSWIGSDAILAELGFNAVVFVDVGRVNAEKQAEYLTWKELDALQRGGRWEVQLQSGTGHHEIQYGPAPEDVGPFYAYRGSEERIDGWRERVFSDITWGGGAAIRPCGRISASGVRAAVWQLRPSRNERPSHPAGAVARGQRRRASRAAQALSRAASRSGAGPVRSRARRRRCPPTGRPWRRAAA